MKFCVTHGMDFGDRGMIFRVLSLNMKALAIETVYQMPVAFPVSHQAFLPTHLVIRRCLWEPPTLQAQGRDLWQMPVDSQNMVESHSCLGCKVISFSTPEEISNNKGSKFILKS